MSLACRLCSSHITGQGSTFACCGKEKLVQAMRSQKSPLARNRSQSRKWMLCCICQDILASNWNGRYAFQLLAKVGNLLSRRCSTKSRARTPWRGIRDLQMRSQLQDGPDLDKCELRRFVRKAIV